MKLRSIMSKKIFETQNGGKISIPLSASGYFNKSEFPNIIREIFSESEIEKMEKIIDKLRAQNDASYNYNRDLPQSYLNNLNKISSYIAKRLEKNGYLVDDTGDNDDTIYISYKQQ